MPDYSKSKIYTIRCKNDNSLIYVGSTIQSLPKRLGSHKIDNIKNPHMLIYSTINNDWDNWYIELHHLYPCSCKAELEREEGIFIREIGNLNKTIAGRTHKEYRNDNREMLLAKSKKYRLENLDKVKEAKQQYYEENKEVINEKNRKYRNENLDRLLQKQREYYEKNKEVINEKIKKNRIENSEEIKSKDREYYHANKEIKSEQRKERYNINRDKILQKHKLKIICECGCEITKEHLARHQKTKKHLELINKL